jgi:hypothetical protein
MRNLFVLLIATLVAAPAFADPATQPSGVGAVRGSEVASDQAAEKPLGPLSLSGGTDFTTGYFFRGYKEQDEGLIVQPYATLTFNVPQLQKIGGSGLSISPYVGTWNSIHTSNAAARKSPANWYETDMIGGVNLTDGPFTLGLVYTFYMSPSGNFRDTQELGVTVAYDDSKLGLLPVALNPHVGVYRELNHSANFEKQGPGTYLEVGIEPSTDVKLFGTTVTFSLPTLVGFGFDDYYGSDSLGYTSVGVKASVPLPFPDSFGEWKLTASVLYLHDFADAAKASNSGHADEVIGTVGVGFSF